MHPRLRRLLPLVVALTLFALSAGAVPPRIGVSGRLTDANGTPPPDGPHTFQFAFETYLPDGGIYPVGPAVMLNSDTKQGYFSLDLDVSSFEWGTFVGQPTRLMLRFEGGPQLPIPLQSVPYAMEAARAPVFIAIPLRDVEPSACVIPRSDQVWAGTRQMPVTNLVLTASDAGCTSPGAQALSASVPLPGFFAHQLVVQAVLVNRSATTLASDATFNLHWSITYNSATQPQCQGNAIVTPVPAATLTPNITYTLRHVIDLQAITCSATTGMLDFQLSRTDNNPVPELLVRGLSVEVR